MLDSGEVKSMAELARLGRVSRARITQIMDLMLAPGIQEHLILGTDSYAPNLRDLIPLCRCPAWIDQRRSARHADE